MLAFFRRRMKIILWVLTVAVIVTFIPWGVGVRMRRTRGSGSAGELFGKTVSRAEYEDAYAAVVTNSELSRSKLSRSQAQQMAWERLLLLKAARRAGVTVSDAEVARLIRAQFGREGSFDQGAYENILKLVAGVSPATYEDWMRQALMIQRLQDMVRNMAWLPDDELLRRLGDEQTKLTIRYALFPVEEMKKSAVLTDAEIEKYYKDHPREFITPPKANARYVFIPVDVPKEEPAPAAEEISRYYEEHPEAFAHGKRVKVRHILFTTAGRNAEKAERGARAKAEKVLARLRKGADFASLAAKYSADEATGGKGGAIGFIEPGDMPKEFSDRAFAMKEGEISEPVKTSRGYHIIKVEAVQDAGEKPLEEVRERIASILKREKAERARDEARQTAYRKAVEISLALVDTPSLDDVARKFGLDIKETGLFARKDNLKEIGENADFAKAAFETEPGSFSDIVELPGKGYCIVVPKERTEEAAESLAHARAKIAKKLTGQKAAANARATAEVRRAEAEKLMAGEKPDFAAACARLGLKTEETAPFTARGIIPGLGYEPGIARAAAALAPGALSPVFETSKGPLFFAVTKRETPGEGDVRKGLDVFRKRALRQEEARILSEWNRALHAQAKMVDYISSERPSATDED